MVPNYCTTHYHTAWDRGYRVKIILEVVNKTQTSQGRIILRQGVNPRMTGQGLLIPGSSEMYGVLVVLVLTGKLTT
jgi:hypothetical protein